MRWFKEDLILHTMMDFCHLHRRATTISSRPQSIALLIPPIFFLCSHASKYQNTTNNTPPISTDASTGAKSIYSFVTVDESITPFAKCQNHADAEKEKEEAPLKGYYEGGVVGFAGFAGFVLSFIKNFFFSATGGVEVA